MKLKTFGERLKEARAKRDLTQEEVSAKLGIKQQRYQPWEAGKAGKQIEPSHEMVQQLANILDVNVEWLLTGKTPVGDHISEEQPPQYGPGPVVEKIVQILLDMDTSAQREVLKYTQEKKLVSKLLKRRKAG